MDCHTAYDTQGTCLGVGPNICKATKWSWSIPWSHYLGDAFQGRLHTKADQTLESTYYDGTKHNFSFEKYIETLLLKPKSDKVRQTDCRAEI